MSGDPGRAGGRRDDVLFAQPLKSMGRAAKRSVPGKKLTRGDAKEILRDLPKENAFYFYRAVDNPILLHSRNLGDFLAVLKMVEAGSIDFHLNRGDFENWVAMLGDTTLASRINQIRGEGLAAEEQRTRLIGAVRSRSLQLAKSSKARDV